jgi:hypothetical protein
MTLAPSSRKSFADAAPMLPAPPVITQTLFCIWLAIVCSPFFKPAGT